MSLYDAPASPTCLGEVLKERRRKPKAKASQASADRGTRTAERKSRKLNNSTLLIKSDIRNPRSLEFLRPIQVQLAVWNRGDARAHIDGLDDLSLRRTEAEGAADVGFHLRRNSEDRQACQRE